MVKLKLLIFDFGDVIGHFDIHHFDRFIKVNSGSSDKIRSFFKRNKPYFDRGHISERSFWINLGKTIESDIPWRAIAKNNQKNLMIDYRMVNLIKTIPLTKILLSNMDKTTVSQIKKEIDLQEIFDEVIFSCDIMKDKLDWDILNNICKKYNLNRKQVLFIDDFLGNIEKANKFGFQTIQFKNYELLLKEMAELKILQR